MLLVCLTCRKHWNLRRGQKRTESCPACRHEHLSSALRMAWKRRRLRARIDKLPAVPYLAVDLAQLIRDVDAASERALQALSSVTLPEKS
jgi:hypothetical protein